MSASQPLEMSDFERLHGERPWRVLDRHPDGRHIALQVITVLHTTVERAAVWDVETRRIVWAPDGVSALAWIPGRGDQVALVSEKYQHAPDHPAIIASPLQSECTYTFALTSWPGQVLQVTCPLTFPTGWPVDLVLSPRGDLAVVQWRDQGESGLEFVALTFDGARQLAETGLPHLAPLHWFPNDGGFPLNSPLMFRPVFSPDGRYLIVPWQSGPKWWNDEGGECLVGTISILDLQERSHRAIPLIDHVPAGWSPPPQEDGAEGLLVEPPTFLDARQFEITLPTGNVQTFTLAEDG